MQLEAQLADRHISIELTPESTSWLVKNGYDDRMGARPLARVIQEHIKKPLADEVLFGALKHGGVVRVIVKNDALSFEFESAPPPRKRPQKNGKGSGPKGSGGDGGNDGGGSSVPKVPLMAE